MSSLQVNQLSALELIPDNTAPETSTENNQPVDLDDKFYDIYLSNEEKQALTYLNKKSNKIREDISSINNIENISIRQIFNNWTKINNDIINEFIEHLNNFFNYNNKEDEQWYQRYIIFIKNILDTITKGDRLLYVGVSVVLISILTNFIIVSS